MRVLHIVNSLTHTSIPIEMACEMMKTEKVEIAALYNSQHEADRFANEMGIDCNIYGFGYKNNKFKGLVRYIKFLNNCSFDIIHTHHSLSGTLARLFCYKSNGNKIVHTVHANYHSYSRKQNLLIGCTLNRCNAIVFNSNSTRKGLYGWERKKIKKVKQKVIYNGVNVDRIIDASEDYYRSFCLEHSIPDNKIVITQIGRLEHVKNPMGSLRAFAKLKEIIDEELYNRLLFVYMGNGSELNKMKKYICENGLDDNVLLPGVIERDNVYSWMKRADILVIPSFYEGFCNTLIEGLVSGISICVSDLDVFKEILPCNTDVRKFNPHNVFSIAQQIKRIIKSYDSNKQLRYNNNANMKYSLQNTVNMYNKLYRFILKT